MRHLCRNAKLLCNTQIKTARVWLMIGLVSLGVFAWLAAAVTACHSFGPAFPP